MNNMKETSLTAYETIKPHLGKMQEAVYDCIERNTIAFNKFLSAKQIKDREGIPINVVVARINELMYDKQLIKVAYVKGNNSYYTIRNGTDPLNIRKSTYKQKWEQLKQSLNLGKVYWMEAEILNLMNSIESK